MKPPALQLANACARRMIRMCIRRARAAQEEFLSKLKGIKGISNVETQTYTLEEAA